MRDRTDLPQRHALRLPHHDYTESAAYFITICTYQRKYLFGDITDGEMQLNALGHVANAELVRSAAMRREIELDVYVVMPNHIHAVVVLAGEREEAAHGDRAATRPPLQTVRGRLAGRSLGALVAGYKSAVTTAIHTLRATPGFPVWQRNYYEHVIRNDEDLRRIRDYIEHNPARWQSDRLYIPRVEIDL